MSKSFDFLGAHKGSFWKQSFQVFTSLSGGLQYVGKTQNEVTVSPGVENVEWFDNSGATQVLYALDIDKIDPSFTFSFMQLGDTNTLALALNGDMDDSDPDTFRTYVGSNPDEYSEAEWRFVGKSVDGRTATYVIRRGIAFSSGDITVGTPGSYSEVPITIRALQDTSITNTKRDLMFVEQEKRSFS
jgi:hypothetical protein